MQNYSLSITIKREQNQRIIITINFFAKFPIKTKLKQKENNNIHSQTQKNHMLKSKKLFFDINVIPYQEKTCENRRSVPVKSDGYSDEDISNLGCLITPRIRAD